MICQILLSVSTSRNEEGNYLDRRWVMSPPRRRGILFIAESSNVAQEPTRGQQDSRTRPLPESCSLDDWMLEQRHWTSVLSEMGQGELMGTIRCTQIPFILVMISQSHRLPLSLPYSANPPVDLKTHISTSTIELFFVMILMTPYAYKSMFYV